MTLAIELAHSISVTQHVPSYPHLSLTLSHLMIMLANMSLSLASDYLLKRHSCQVFNYVLDIVALKGTFDQIDSESKRITCCLPQ